MSLRAERAEQVQQLAGDGLSVKQIAERMHVSASYVRELRTDPDGSVAAARRVRHRDSRRRQCSRCERTARAGDQEPALCAWCARAEEDHRARIWVRSRLESWVVLYGSAPTVADWNPTETRLQGLTAEHRTQLLERHNGQGWPSSAKVIRLYGSWNSFLLANGHASRTNGDGERRRSDRRRLTDGQRQQVLELAEGGATVAQISRQTGVSRYRIDRALAASRTGGQG